MNPMIAHSQATTGHPVWPLFLGIEAASTEQDWQRLFQAAEDACTSAFGMPGERQASAEMALHRVLYALYAGRIAAPWTSGWRNLDHHRFDRLRQMFEDAWSERETACYRDFFGPLPAPADFEAWATRHCQAHRSNVGHPLFAYLRDTASYAQLREFLIQETPFDIHFGDILAKMLPGVYGAAKSEFSKNFWDEMGRGETAAMHRQLRLDMTSALDEVDDVYLSQIERFCVEELRLANMYFHAVFNRALLPQAIGMMLATELMVPGRLDQQIMGWRRIGWTDDRMRYLLEHTVVDVEHAHGWMNEVVLPLLAKQPELLAPIALGMARRLEHAAEVCDRMMVMLPTVRPTSLAA
ncbi:iron-containing redox enzyme family protein [Burkholderia sp. TSV86]|uniref:iron-containing redox enzyme family protein n=1 Tax=Burkholderia sp. TSV86 TaxID=1385594 RepID=UPI000B0C38D7|nr:iron-containing redox enzyme family protein [Burkholderia sp. TSV86]